MSVNKVILLGFLGNDPDARTTQGGTAVTNVSLATSKKWRDKNSGEMREDTEWSRVVFFNRLAEIAGQYLKKGSQIYVEGRLQTRKWTDKNGIDRYSTEIIAHELQMLGGPQRDQYSNDNRPDYGRAPEPQVPQIPDFDDLDADIPF